jgi:hypothetical protein
MLFMFGLFKMIVYFCYSSQQIVLNFRRHTKGFKHPFVWQMEANEKTPQGQSSHMLAHNMFITCMKCLDLVG